jgi:hypothetical protein
LAKGTIPPLLFSRKKYFLADMAHDINQVIFRYQQQQEELQTSLQEMKNGKTEEAKQRLQNMVSS